MKLRRSLFETLAEYMEASKRSQAEVAQELGVSPSYLSMMLSGQRRPSGDLALRIAERYRVSLVSLLRTRKKAA